MHIRIDAQWLAKEPLMNQDQNRFVVLEQMMPSDFSQLLITALAADYFLISDLVQPDPANEFHLQTPLASTFAHLTHYLGIERGLYDSQDGNWVKLEFDSIDGKQRLAEYFSEFNLAQRIAVGWILMPNIYNGQTLPDMAIAQEYLRRISIFFHKNFEGSILIPVRGEDDIGNAFASYTIDGSIQMITSDQR